MVNYSNRFHTLSAARIIENNPDQARRYAYDAFVSACQEKTKRCFPPCLRHAPYSSPPEHRAGGLESAYALPCGMFRGIEGYDRMQMNYNRI